MTGPNRGDRRRAWPKRRQWLDRVAGETRLTRGAKAWLLLLARRSDDAGKPVWGNQVKMAEQLDCSDRTVRRYLVEAAALGYVQVFRSKPRRGPDGRWHRRRANAYYLCVPGRETAHQDAPRRRQRAPYCVVKATRPRWLLLPDTDGRSTPSGAPTTPRTPPIPVHQATTHPTEPPAAPDAATFFAHLRDTLQHAKANITGQ
jgi:Helix-turn-helix domain